MRRECTYVAMGFMDQTGKVSADTIIGFLGDGLSSQDEEGHEGWNRSKMNAVDDYRQTVLTKPLTADDGSIPRQKPRKTPDEEVAENGLQPMYPSQSITNDPTLWSPPRYKNPRLQFEGRQSVACTTQAARARSSLSKLLSLPESATGRLLQTSVDPIPFVDPPIKEVERLRRRCSICE
ncbi:unnamed protein product [Darwinula stevensoni]|uniref:Uncharacterized protein n=1 Tax=Darwinula stevensoni TaxID=69355 RepID=A0A7R9FRJ3_9CRUS|nr:unnamed protein product [Darwinula stevensoni]CAG0901778.1 unnamed protein product [Darwinula stevensoni]